MITFDDYEEDDELEEPSLLPVDRQRRRELFIEKHQEEWRKRGKKYRYIRKLMEISHYELAKCLGLSPSVILAFEEGKPVQRPRFVEGAYLAALTSFFHNCNHRFYCLRLSNPIFTLTDILVNWYNSETITLKNLYELVDTFNFKYRLSFENEIYILDDRGNELFSVTLEEVI